MRKEDKEVGLTTWNQAKANAGTYATPSEATTTTTTLGEDDADPQERCRLDPIGGINNGVVLRAERFVCRNEVAGTGCKLFLSGMRLA